MQMTDTPYSVPCSLQHCFLQILDTFLPLLISGHRTQKRIRKKKVIFFLSLGIEIICSSVKISSKLNLPKFSSSSLSLIWKMYFFLDFFVKMKDWKWLTILYWFYFQLLIPLGLPYSNSTKIDRLFDRKLTKNGQKSLRSTYC